MSKTVLSLKTMPLSFERSEREGRERSTVGIGKDNYGESLIMIMTRQ